LAQKTKIAAQTTAGASPKAPIKIFKKHICKYHQWFEVGERRLFTQPRS